jgi:hypothetical protein
MAKRAGRRKALRHPILLTEHVFDKLRSIDLSLSEFEILLDGGLVIEETVLRAGALKELVLLIEWIRPLHIVVVVDDSRREERIVTVYEPDPARWSRDFRRRR